MLVAPGQPTKCVSFCPIFCTSKPLLSNPGNGSGLHLTLHLCGQVSATPPDYFGCLFGVAQVWQYHPKLCYFYFSLLQQVLQVSGQSPKRKNIFLWLVVLLKVQGISSVIPTPFLFKPDIKLLWARFGTWVPLAKEVSYLNEYLWLYIELEQHNLSLTKPRGIFSFSHAPIPSLHQTLLSDPP